MSDTPRLDPSQERASSAPRDARQIVIAGPGAGKSEVVGARCRQLLDDDVYPEEILVISFSNAAVGVVRDRTRDVVDEGRGIDLATLDSLAARIRSELEESEPVFAGYDDSIRRATTLLENAERPVFADVRHIIVDEVQDIVGVRTQFVLTLLSKGVQEEAGFTLLGDPMQSLYDFQKDSAGRWSAETFLDQVRQRYLIKETVLSGEYRARTEDARAASKARAELTELPRVERLHRLTDLLAGLPPIGEVDQDLADDVSRWRGLTAFLCDTNARAGLVASRLAAYGIPVELAAAATEPTLAPWIGRILGAYHSGAIARGEFVELAEAEGLPDPLSAWQALVRMADCRGDLELSALGAGLRSRKWRPELLRSPSVDFIASTVHRAKGLEFDNVVLVDPEDWLGDEPDASARRLFVAMSRARSRLSRAGGICVRYWRKDRPTGTWLQTSPRGRGHLGVLLEPSYARELGPSEVTLNSVIGSSVTWAFDENLTTVDGEELPSWTANIDGIAIARTGEEFGRLVSRLSFSGRAPGLRGGRVEGLETIVGAPSETFEHHGFWTGARVSGPITFEWE